MDIIRDRATLTDAEQKLAGLGRHNRVWKIDFWNLLARTSLAEADLQLQLNATLPLTPERTRAFELRYRAYTDRALACAMAAQLLSLPCEIELWPPPSAPIEQ